MLYKTQRKKPHHSCSAKKTAQNQLSKQLAAVWQTAAKILILSHPIHYFTTSRNMSPQKVIIKVDTMTCKHCTNYVSNSINTLNGILKTETDIPSSTATVEFDADIVSKESIISAINETHYKAVELV